jgi:hypothetical protein
LDQLDLQLGNTKLSASVLHRRLLHRRRQLVLQVQVQELVQHKVLLQLRQFSNEHLQQA